MDNNRLDFSLVLAGGTGGTRYAVARRDVPDDFYRHAGGTGKHATNPCVGQREHQFVERWRPNTCDGGAGRREARDYLHAGRKRKHHRLQPATLLAEHQRCHYHCVVFQHRRAKYGNGEYRKPCRPIGQTCLRAESGRNHTIYRPKY